MNRGGRARGTGTDNKDIHHTHAPYCGTLTTVSGNCGLRLNPITIILILRCKDIPT